MDFDHETFTNYSWHHTQTTKLKINRFGEKLIFNTFHFTRINVIMADFEELFPNYSRFDSVLYSLLFNGLNTFIYTIHQRDPILSFLLTFLAKSACVGGRPPPRVSTPPMGNP